MTVKIFVFSLVLTASFCYAQNCQEGFRLFDHAYLEGDPVCIPETPMRVAPLDILTFEFLLINDMQPAVTSELALQFFSTTQPEWLPKFRSLTVNLADVGFPADPEVVLAAAPDLIIGTSGYYDANVYDEMAQIAPMIVFDPPIDTVGQDWQPNFDFIGAALGMSAAVTNLVVGYERRVAALRDALGETSGETLDGQMVSVVRAAPPDALGLCLAGSFSGVLLNDLGVTQPESQRPFYDKTTNFIQIDVGRESWAQVDGDYLFIYGVQPTPEGTTEAQTLVASLEDDPIWNALEVVQRERVYAVGGHWHGFGVLAAHDVMDDMFRLLAGVEPAEVSPNPLEPE